MPKEGPRTKMPRSQRRSKNQDPKKDQKKKSKKAPILLTRFTEGLGYFLLMLL
jgi:hypothetical protein